MTTEQGGSRASVVLVASSLGAGGSPEPSEHALAEEVRAWADRFGYRIVVLPEPGYRSRPDADAAERRRLGRQDRVALVAALDGVKRELPPGERVLALLVADDDVSGQAGRAWYERLTGAAARVRIELPRPARLSAEQELDAERLERRILASAD